MSGFFSKIKSAFQTPSMSQTSTGSKKSKSAGDLNYLTQVYTVKEKELPKLHLAAWKGEMDKVVQLCRPDKLNSLDKDGRSAH